VNIYHQLSISIQLVGNGVTVFSQRSPLSLLCRAEVLLVVVAVAAGRWCCGVGVVGS
jgi:hypothetical protein